MPMARRKLETTQMRGREKEGHREIEKFVWFAELEDTEMPYITYCQMFQMGLLLKIEKKDAFKNHLRFHKVSIKSNLLYLFGNWKGRINKEEDEFPPCLL